MQNKVYISTSCFKTNNLKEILDLCLENNFKNLELGSNIEYGDENLELISSLKGRSMNFILHNYFPRPKNDFVLNLASDDKKILSKSIAHCKKAIDLSVELEAPFYSVHAGFAFHALPDDLGHQQIQLARIPYQKAYEIFLNSAKELADYAKIKNVKLAVENGVVQRFNLINGRNEIFLLIEAEDMLKFYKDISSDNLFYLVDLGHLKVNSANLNFDREDRLNKILPYTIAFHLSENNGSFDQHLHFDDEIWFKDVLKNNRDKFFILESCKLALFQIKKCCESIMSILN